MTMTAAAPNLKGRHFLKLLDFSPDEIRYFLDLAADLKAQKKRSSGSGRRRSASSSKRPPRAPAVASRSPLTTRAPT